MRIFLLVDVYKPVAQAAATLMDDLAHEIKNRGHDVCVMAPAPDLEKTYSIEDRNGIDVVRVRTPVFKGISRSYRNPLMRKLANIRRGFLEGQLSQVMWKNAGEYLKENPADLIVYYSPTIFFGDLVLKLKTLWQAPSYLILRDIFPQWLVDAGEISPCHPGLFFLRHKENINYKAADVIAVQSPANLDYFKETGRDKDHDFDILYNWTDSNRFQKPTGKYRKKFGYDEDDVIFFFGGTFTEAQDMDNLLRLARNLEGTPQAKFLFVGKGPYYNKLEEKITTGDHRNVTLSPAVDHETFLEIMADIDVGLITLDRRLKTHNIPGKLLDYIVFGKPVLASLNPGNDLADILNESGAGFAFENGEDEMLAAAARKLADSKTLRSETKEKSLTLQKEVFSVQRAADQVLSARDKTS